MGRKFTASGLRRLRPALPVIAIGALLALLPFPTCVLRLAVGIPCPACGLTRAALAIAHLDLARAQRLHPLGLALLGLSVVTASLAFVTSDAAWRRILKWALGVAGVSLILVWALRFAGFFGGPVPGEGSLGSVVSPPVALLRSAKITSPSRPGA